MNRDFADMDIVGAQSVVDSDTIPMVMLPICLKRTESGSRYFMVDITDDGDDELTEIFESKFREEIDDEMWTELRDPIPYRPGLRLVYWSADAPPEPIEERDVQERLRQFADDAMVQAESFAKDNNLLSAAAKVWAAMAAIPGDAILWMAAIALAYVAEDVDPNDLAKALCKHLDSFDKPSLQTAIDFWWKDPRFNSLAKRVQKNANICDLVSAHKLTVPGAKVLPQSYWRNKFSNNPNLLSEAGDHLCAA